MESGEVVLYIYNEDEEREERGERREERGERRRRREEGRGGERRGEYPKSLFDHPRFHANIELFQKFQNFIKT
jgi:hypothetical protein